MGMKSVLVVHEKHGDYYYDASTDEARLKAFYSILKERNEAGYWYYRPQPPEEAFNRSLKPGEEEFLTMTEEAVEALPEALKTQVQRVRNRKRGLEREYEREMVWFNMLDEVLALPFEEAKNLVEVRRSRDGSREWKNHYIDLLMEGRRDYQYEGYDLETVHEPKL